MMTGHERRVSRVALALPAVVVGTVAGASALAFYLSDRDFDRPAVDARHIAGVLRGVGLKVDDCETGAGFACPGPGVHSWNGRFDDGRVSSLLFPRSAWVFTLVVGRAPKTWCIQAGSWEPAGLLLLHLSSGAAGVVRAGPCPQ